MKKLIKNPSSLILGVFLFLLIFSQFQFAQATVDLGMRVIEDEIRLTSEDPRSITVRLVNIALSFLGIIAVIIILFGGFKWMTAGGNEEKVRSAKKLLISGLIGLVIILTSWGIVNYLIDTVSAIAS